MLPGRPDLPAYRRLPHEFQFVQFCPEFFNRFAAKVCWLYHALSPVR